MSSVSSVVTRHPLPAGADFAWANLLFGLVASAVALASIVFDRKAWRAQATTATSIPSREATPATPVLL